MPRERRNSSSFLAFLSGAAVGAASALLFAPRSGDQTRERLQGYVRSGRQQTQQFQSALNAASEAAKQAFFEALEGHPRVEAQRATPAGTQAPAAGRTPTPT